MTVEIPLSRGLVAIVDDHDAPFVNQWKWMALKAVRKYSEPVFYAVRFPYQKGGPRTCIFMHRELLHAPPGMDVDHVNSNPLDNRRDNLRLATRTQNNANRREDRNQYGFRGVAQMSGKYRARIQVHKKQIYTPNCYSTPEEAAAAYDSLARKYFGEFARLNFPDLRPSEPPFFQENRSAHK